MAVFASARYYGLPNIYLILWRAGEGQLKMSLPHFQGQIVLDSMKTIPTSVVIGTCGRSTSLPIKTHHQHYPPRHDNLVRHYNAFIVVKLSTWQSSTDKIKFPRARVFLVLSTYRSYIIATNLQSLKSSSIRALESILSTRRLGFPSLLNVLSFESVRAHTYLL